MRLAAVLFLALLLLPGFALAGPLEDGAAAFQQKDWPAAMRLLLPLAEQGNGEAQVYVGYMHEFGRGVAKNPAAALKWFRKSADHKNAEAQFKIGYIYKRGLGVPPDNAKALRWFRQAADQGEGTAQFMLGGMYANGDGVKQDWQESFFWFLLMPPEDSTATKEDHEAALTKIYAAHLTPEQMETVKIRVHKWKPKPDRAIAGKKTSVKD
jgi:uncharacterized protein